MRCFQVTITTTQHNPIRSHVHHMMNKLLLTHSAPLHTQRDLRSLRRDNCVIARRHTPDFVVLPMCCGAAIADFNFNRRVAGHAIANSVKGHTAAVWLKSLDDR